jgi:uncharacterized coiled-coil protein SlyX
MNNNSIPPPRPAKQPGFFSGLTSGLGNLLGTSSSSSSPPPPPENQQEDNSFKYSIEMSDEFPLKTEFTNLAKAINDKNDILKLYQDLLPALQYLDTLLTKLGNERGVITDEKRALTDEIVKLNSEKQELERDLKNANEIEKNGLKNELSQKNTEIADAKSRLAELENASVVNQTTIENIKKLVAEATKYINGMKPNDKNDIQAIRKLVNKMQDTVQADPNNVGYLNANASANTNDNDRESSIIGDMTLNPQNVNRIGGYRYSSSQMRRKSTAKRSSASGSSSSKRRRNKKRTAKKIMLGGKRMKKTKSTKRKHNKKC